MKMYSHITEEEKVFIHHKIAIKTKVSEELIKTILTEVDPPIKIDGKSVILFHYSWDTIQKKIKNYL